MKARNFNGEREGVEQDEMMKQFYLSITPLLFILAFQLASTALCKLACVCTSLLQPLR